MTDRTRQAVILAGGRGTRLAPLTHTRPKPMIEFHGRPFLEYLIEMLREQGFERVLLLLGYLPQVIQDYFGDGSRFGLDVEYSVSDVDDETGRRLKLAHPRLAPQFLLMYCDNYWPMRIDRMWEQWQRSGTSAQLTYYANDDAYTRSNLRAADGLVTTYDKSRTTPGLAGVDIGFVLMERGVVETLPDANCSFEGTVYPDLVSRGQLGAFRTEHRYYSVGSHERLPLTNEFLARRPAVFLDRDGVLNRRMPRACYVRSRAEWEWLPGALDALRLLHEGGYRVFLITNQPGVARGAMSVADLEDVHSGMLADVGAAGGEISGIYACMHNWDDGCACRKPRAGLLYQAQREHQLDLSRTPFFGDDERDAEAADAAGCPFIQVTEEQSLLRGVEALLRTVPA